MIFNFPIKISTVDQLGCKLCALKMLSVAKGNRKVFSWRTDVCKMTYFMTIRSLVLHLVFSLICVEFMNAQLLVPDDMYELLRIEDFEKSEETTECKRALDGKWFPEVPYVWGYCDTASGYLTKLQNVDNAFDCWESQLTEVTKFELLNIMNQYRQRVSNGICTRYCKETPRLVFELEWNKEMEKSAMNRVIDFSKLTKYYDTGIYPSNTFCKNHPFSCDNSTKTVNLTSDFFAISFEMISGLQRELKLVFRKLLSEYRFFDWKETDGGNSIFRRALMIEVGCAFMLRRGVDGNTTYGENVINGNIGYLLCEFIGMGDTETEPNVGKMPADASCNEAMRNAFGHSATLSDMYPKLCKFKYYEFGTFADGVKNPRFPCQPNETYLKSVCGTSHYRKSEVTWDEKAYGYLVGIDGKSGAITKAMCNLPKKLPNMKYMYTSTHQNYNCTFKQEVFVDVACQVWNCTDSQLTEITRSNIIANLNAIRNQIAFGQCSFPIKCPWKTYCNMVKLQWHWFLEWKAAEKVRFCNQTNSTASVFYDDHPFHDPAFFEETVLHFISPVKKRTPGQWNLHLAVRDLFWENSFQDWSMNDPADPTFRRSNAQWVGCAVIVNSTNSRPEFYLVCIYASLQNPFNSIIGKPDNFTCCPTCTEPVSISNPCPVRTSKNIIPYLNLCTSVLSDFTMNCQVSQFYRCKDETISSAWSSTFDSSGIRQRVDGSYEEFVTSSTATTVYTTFKAISTTRSISRRETSNVENVFTNEPEGTDSTESENRMRENAYKKKYCLVLIVFFLVLLSSLGFMLSLVFKYEVEKKIFTK